MRYFYWIVGGSLLRLAILPAPAPAQMIGIDATQMEALQIRLEKVRPAAREAVALLPGTVVPPLNSRVAVSAPFAGTVLQVGVLAGQHVEEGAPLVTIASREMLEAIARLRQSEVELRNAELNAKRQRALADKQAGSEMKAQEAEAEAAKLRVATEQYRRILSLGNIVLNRDGSYSLTAPKSGHIAETRVSAGASLDAMAPAVIVDAGDELWLEAQLPAYLAGRVKKGDEIEVVPGIEGSVISVGSALDPVTRSATLLARIVSGAPLVPGQMVTLSVSRPLAEGALSVPPRSLAHLSGKHVVFKRTDSGFAVTPVSVRGEASGSATVDGGISAGDEVAVSGIAELEKILAGE